MEEPKILLFDIETAPNLGYVWGKYDQNVIDYKNEWYMLCYAAKWLDKKKIMTSKLTDFPSRFKKNKEDDLGVVKELWKLLDEADIVIAHNGVAFDVKKTYARFIYHGLPPPSPFKQIDTIKEARKYFKFNSNRLDDLGAYLGVGRKLEHEGFPLWLKCMQGKKYAWNKMIKYNKQDVLLLERVYEKFKPYITNHPNLGLYKQQDFSCPNCGSKHLQKRGFNRTKVNMYQRYQCQKCGAWSQNTKCEKNIVKPKVKN